MLTEQVMCFGMSMILLTYFLYFIVKAAEEFMAFVILEKPICVILLYTKAPPLDKRMSNCARQDFPVCHDDGSFGQW